MIETVQLSSAPSVSARRPRVGFLGVGWIGRRRMVGMLSAVDAVAIADPCSEMAEAALKLTPGAVRAGGLDHLLDLDLDGLVIATPSALHAGQAIAALQRGLAVFCQKPLGRSAAETSAVVEAARAADRLLAVDLSYRFTEAAVRIRDLVQAQALGRVFAADLVFHNAYGPDKAWFYDRALSGGGCVIDLGVHLVDLALWMLDFPAVTDVTSTLLARGAPLDPSIDQVEDYAVATLSLAGGACVRIACSWGLQAGCDAEISAAFYGARGGAALRNVGGSFYDFEAHHFEGSVRREIARPPDAWGDRAALDWARQLARGGRYDAKAERLAEVAATLDRIYAR